MSDGYQSTLFQPVTFYAVVYDVAKAVKSFSVGEFLFCLLYGSSHAEAEAAASIYFYCHNEKRLPSRLSLEM